MNNVRLSHFLYWKDFIGIIESEYWSSYEFFMSRCFLSRVELKKIVLTELEIFFNPVCYEL